MAQLRRARLLWHQTLSSLRAELVPVETTPGQRGVLSCSHAEPPSLALRSLEASSNLLRLLEGQRSCWFPSDLVFDLLAAAPSAALSFGFDLLQDVSTLPGPSGFRASQLVGAELVSSQALGSPHLLCFGLFVLQTG